VGVALLTVFTWGVWHFLAIHLSPTSSPITRADGQGVEAGKAALAAGRFRSAAEDLEAAQAAAAGRSLAQLAREANLLADVLDWSMGENPRVPPPARAQLETLLTKAPAARDERQEQEWRLQFARRYRGKALVFDDVIHRNAGRFYLQPPLEANGRKGLVELSGVKLLRDLPPNWPQRLLFGARLAGCAVEPPGTYWVYRFEPDSGVLLTDRSAVEAYFGTRPTADRLQLLQRQAEWAADLP
jgi:hypothetical protein